MVLKNKYLFFKYFRIKNNINKIIFIKNFNKVLKLKLTKIYKDKIMFKILNE